MDNPNPGQPHLPKVDRAIIQGVQNDIHDNAEAFYGTEEAELKQQNGALWDFIGSQAFGLAPNNPDLRARIIRLASIILETVERAEEAEYLDNILALNPETHDTPTGDDYRDGGV